MAAITTYDQLKAAFPGLTPNTSVGTYVSYAKTLIIQTNQLVADAQAQAAAAAAAAAASGFSIDLTALNQAITNYHQQIRVLEAQLNGLSGYNVNLPVSSLMDSGTPITPITPTTLPPSHDFTSLVPTLDKSFFNYTILPDAHQNIMGRSPKLHKLPGNSSTGPQWTATDPGPAGTNLQGASNDVALNVANNIIAIQGPIFLHETSSNWYSLSGPGIGIGVPDTPPPPNPTDFGSLVTKYWNQVGASDAPKPPKGTDAYKAWYAVTELLQYNYQILKFLLKATDLNLNVTTGTVNAAVQNWKQQVDTAIEGVINYAQSFIGTTLAQQGGKAMTLNGISISYIDSTSFTFNYQTGGSQFTGGVLKDIIYGSGLSDTINGGGGDDLLVGNGGNDRLIGGGGNNILFGGATGKATAVFDYSSTSYTITKVAGTDSAYQVKTKAGAPAQGINELHDIKRLEFTDKKVALDSGVGEIAGAVYRLYKTAFDRVPDAPGLGHNIRLVDGGLTLAQMSAAFVVSAEFTNTYGALSNAQFINQLYLNVLDRAPDAPGLAWNLNLLNTTLARAEMLSGFSESAENQLAIIGQIQDGIWFT